ncbi:hypothetical protein [Kangiella sp.]|uniref:hypothetical protein n=1 Tax=Kangiella sp. TaxID=1920245 RepID=UPI0025C41228|nr:hypothetical protein [Kangiella sp.]
MSRVQNPNMEILMLAVNRLAELADDMVFLGGCATGLLITDSASPPIRVTRDVDAIVQVATKHEYYQLAERLREKGFSEDLSEDAPLCRWTSEDVVLDVMPTNPDILGFGNEWYAIAADNTFEYRLPNKKSIQVVTAPYFLITKIEAFEGRGNGDYMYSHDIEDIVAVLEGRPELLEDIASVGEGIKSALADKFRTLLNDKKFMQSIPGHLPSDSVSQQRVPYIIKVIEQVIDIS